MTSIPRNNDAVAMRAGQIGREDAMHDPFRNFTQTQIAFLDGWASGTRHILEAWRHMIDLQEHFLHRAMEHHRTHIEIAEGPSLTDKYGRRAHDIDVERDV
jgi:hypothetical protein